MKPIWICHGNEESWRVKPEDIMFMGTITIHKLRIGPRGGMYWSAGFHLSNPDWYRSYVPGTNRTRYAEDCPFPLSHWCEQCGFLFEGGRDVTRYDLSWLRQHFPELMLESVDEPEDYK